MSNTFQLVTPRLVLRRWEERDRTPFAVMNADPEVMTYFAAPLTMDESNAALDRYNMQLERDGFTMFAAELRSTRELAGVIGMQTMRDVVPNLPQPAVEIGWRLAGRFQGKGLATEGARSVLEFAFLQRGLSEIVSITAVGNKASRNVMQKLGLTHQPSLDFDHPRMAAGHPHQRHVLYSLTAERFHQQEAACSSSL